nr:hypothetical protein GCM10020092_072660 [Actinoplanes digitatis]
MGTACPPTPLCRKSEGELRDALLKVFPGPDAMTDLLLAADLSFEDFVMPRSDHRANVLHLVQQLNGRGEILRLLDRAHHEVPECKTFGELREEALGREATHLMIALPYARADGLRLVRWATDQVAPMPVTLHPLEETSGDRVIGCDVMMFVATGASVAPDSSCLYQLERAIELGMDVIGVVKDPDVVMPGRIAETMAVDLAGDPVLGRRRLLRHLERLASPDLLMDRLRRQRDRFRRQAVGADARERPWYAAEIEYLSERIDAAESRMADLPATERMVDAAIADGQNKEREPDAAMPERQAVRCPYEPPSVPPKEFQNRIEELQAIERTLADGSARLLVLTGRDGVGKTGMVSRLLYRIRNGSAPPALDAFVYLGTQGHRKLDGGVLLRALLRVVPEQRGVDELADLVHAPVPAVDKLNALLRALGDDRVVVAVDNCETALNAAGDLSDRELRALVHRILDRRDHGVRILISSRRDPLALAEKYAHTRYQSRGEGLSREEAFKLLRAMGGERVRDLPEPSADELYWFHRHTKGLPRAIELAFGELSTPGRSLSWLIGEMDGAERAGHRHVPVRPRLQAPRPVRETGRAGPCRLRPPGPVDHRRSSAARIRQGRAEPPGAGTPASAAADTRGRRPLLAAAGPGERVGAAHHSARRAGGSRGRAASFHPASPAARGRRVLRRRPPVHGELGGAAASRVQRDRTAHPRR